MRSRSYYAIAGSSLLLLSISCVAQKTKQDRHGDEAVSAVQADMKAEAEDAALDEGKAQESGEGQQDDGEQTTGTGTPPAAGDGGSEDGGFPQKGAEIASKMPPRGKDGCHPGQMRFEGKCVSKDRVTKILERREAEAMAKVRASHEAGQTAQAANDLIEQQIQQMNKSEDDLDEIIDQLQREEEARKDPPPDKQEDGP